MSFRLYPAAKVSDRTQQLGEELHKPIIKEIEKWNVYSSFKDNDFGAGLVDL